MGKGEAEEPAPRDGKALLSAGGLVLAVAAVFVLGAVLHREVPVAAPEAVDVPAPLAAAEPVPAPPPPQDVEPVGLAGRTRADLGRAAARAEAWTLQLVVACREEGVQRLLDAAAGDDRLYVLPREVEGRACWAVTWGTFSSEAEAVAASPPAALRLREAPRPRALSSFAAP
jgi:septal ring-binding cell division protein DamX